MFTGLVEDVGRVAWLLQKENGYELQIEAEKLASKMRRGDSMAINGCCLTATTIRSGKLTFDLLRETLDKTNLHRLRPEMLVNLERAVKAEDRMGGHFVQGHVDCTAEVLEFSQRGQDWKLEIALPEDFAHYVAYKGSIAINGISLTVAGVSDASFHCWIIPHTFAETNLQTIQAGDLVNLEFDILAKYVERILQKKGMPVAAPGDSDFDVMNQGEADI